MKPKALVVQLAQRRGDGLPNPIRQAPMESLGIQLVYPPWLTNDITDRPLADFDYTLEVGPLRKPGRTNSTGMLKELVPIGYNHGTLTIWPKEQRYDIARALWIVDLVIGDLSPRSEPSGIAQRLTNLGLFAGAVSGNMDETLTRGLERFRTLFMEPGKYDLYRKLEEVNGC